MNIRSIRTISLLTMSSIFTLAGTAQAENWNISAVGSCRTIAGSTVESGGGLKAYGGTAIVARPLIKEVVGDALINVWARLKRASASGGSSFCNVENKNWDGSLPVLGYGWSIATTSPQSISISLPTQYTNGYSDLYCVLNVNDTFYGAHSKQLNQ